MTVDRLIAGVQARAVLTALALLVTLYLVIDLLDSARHLFSGDTAVIEVLGLYLYKLPASLHLMLPVALVVGTSAAFALLGRSRQLRALAAAGLSPLRLLLPVGAVAAAVVAAMMLLAEFGVPPATDRYEKWMMEHFGRIDSSWRFFRSHMWVQGDAGRLIRIGRKDDDGRRLQYLIVLEVDEDFRLRRRLDIKKLTWRDGAWQAERVQQRDFAGGRLVDYRRMARTTLGWTERPDRFRDLSGRPRQKRLGELSATIALLERRGLQAGEYRLERHNRWAYPLLGLLLLVFAFPRLADPARRRSLAGELLQAVGLVFAAYLMVALATTAVSGGLLAPWAGAWLPPLAILAAAGCSWGLHWRRGRGGDGA